MAHRSIEHLMNCPLSSGDRRRLWAIYDDPCDRLRDARFEDIQEQSAVFRPAVNYEDSSTNLSSINPPCNYRNNQSIIKSTTSYISPIDVSATVHPFEKFMPYVFNENIMPTNASAEFLKRRLKDYKLFYKIFQIVTLRQIWDI